MEFALLGVLGAFGYYYNNKKTSIAPENNEIITASQLEDEFNTKVEQHLAKDNVVIGGQTDLSNNVPFFRSMKSQNTNGMVKDRRLETFTGVNNVDYHKKREREADAPIQGLTNIHGTTFAPDMERYSGYVTNGVQNNVTPFEKEYIGPGLGISPDTPSSGGFHQRFRIMPDNVNGYRKNTFGGEVVVGKSPIDNGTSIQDATRNPQGLTAEEMRSLGDRPLDAAHGHVHAPQVYANGSVSLSDQNNRSLELGCLVGGASMEGAGAHVVQETSRTSEHLYPTCFVGGQHRPGFAGGAYQTSRYLVSSESDRETTNCHRLNVGGNMHGSVVAQASTMETQRGDSNTQQLLGKQQPGTAFVSRLGFSAPVTQKDLSMSNPNYHNHMGIVGSGVAQGGRVGVQDDARETMRGTPFNSNGAAGPAGSYLSASQTYDTRYTEHASRELATVMDHTPNAQRTVNMMLGANELKNTVTQGRYDENIGRVTSNGLGIGTQNFSDRSQLGMVSVSDTPTAKNTRDFGYVPENALRTNIMVQPTDKYY